MFRTVHTKISAAAQCLHAEVQTGQDALDAVLAHIRKTLRGLEIGEATIAQCLDQVRQRVEATRALNRPHPRATVKAIILDVLQAEKETAGLFPISVGGELPWKPRAMESDGWQRLMAGVRRRRVQPETLARIVDQDVLRSVHHFTPGPRVMDVQAARLDAQAMKRHLRQLRPAKPDFGQEPPDGGTPARI